MIEQIFEEIRAERQRQNEKFGEQNYPMLGKRDSLEECRSMEILFRNINKTENGFFSWLTILQEEVYEAFAETEPEKQHEELIQVAAVVVEVIECLERRNK